MPNTTTLPARVSFLPNLGRDERTTVEYSTRRCRQSDWRVSDVASTTAPVQQTATEAGQQPTVSTQQFKAFRGIKQPRFVNDSERECAEILDFYGVPWEYEPITFVLETDETGRIAEAFSPDFYLPEQNLFLEITTMRQELVTRKNRKVRKLRQRYPDVNVKLFYRRDIEALGQKLQSRRAPLQAAANAR